MTVRRLLRVGMNVENLDRAQEFYVEALGFAPVSETREDPALTRLLGVRRSHSRILGLGEQRIELTACDPPGLPYPSQTSDADTWFQYFAMVTPDLVAAVERLRRFRHAPITQDGPQRLPATFGSGIGFQFRDPDGHPLQLVQFAGNARPPGIDHSAISVTDFGVSVSFYEQLGLSRVSPEASADVVRMRLPDHATPFLALLGHHGTPGRSMITDFPDIAATRLVFEGDTSDGEPVGMFDPDGHALLIAPDPVQEN